MERSVTLDPPPPRAGTLWATREVAAEPPTLASTADPAVRARIIGAYAAVILPTLNEEKGLARTLSQIPLQQFNLPGRRVQVLVIDGGSTDRTLEVARAAGVAVLAQTTRGKGAAVVEAIEWVRTLGVEYAVVLDADATYPPDRITPTLDLLRGGTDLVIGVRRPVWGAPRDRVELVHRFGNVLFSYTASLLARRTILDLCSGFWGVSTDMFAQLSVGGDRFAIEGELVLKAVRRGFRVQQIPVDYRDRLGEAKLHAVRDGGHILLTILQHARPGRTRAVDKAPNPSWGRAVLAICLAAGSSKALLTCDPAQSVEAHRVAQYLRRTLPHTEVEVARKSAAPHSSVSAASSVPTENPALVVSLLMAGARSGAARSVTVSIRTNQRNLTVELPSEAPDGPHAAVSGVPRNRAGALSSARWSHDRPRSALPLITSRLNYRPEIQQRMLLNANGFDVLVRRGSRPGWDDETAGADEAVPVT